MNAVIRDIFRAVHEGKWLSIEYRNREEQVTRYWIGIRDLNVRKRTRRWRGFILACTRWRPTTGSGSTGSSPPR